MSARHYRSIMAVTAIIIAMGIVGQSDYEEEQRQHAEYCEMVKLWKKTNGKHGWPAYNGEGTCEGERQ